MKETEPFDAAAHASFQTERALFLARQKAKEDRDVGLGYLSAIATFLIAWIFCMNAYGFLWGFGFGWVPSAILAGLVGFAMRYAWIAVAIIMALCLTALIFQ